VTNNCNNIDEYEIVEHEIDKLKENIIGIENIELDVSHI
jgi:hypothetical protein